MPDSRRKKRGSSERKASPSDEEKPKGSDAGGRSRSRRKDEEKPKGSEAGDRSRSRRKDQRDGQKQDSAVAASEASQQEAKATEPTPRVREDTPSEKRSRSRSREERSTNKKKAKSRSREKEPRKRTTRSSTGRRDKKHSRSASRHQRSRSASRRRRSRSGSRPAQRKSCSASRRRRSRSSSHRKNNRSRSKRRHQSRQRGKKDSRDRSPAQRRRRSSSRDGHRETKAKGKASDRRRSDDKEEDGSRGREGQRPSSDEHAGRPTQDRQAEASAQLPQGIEQPPPPPPPQQPPPPISGQTTASASSTAPAPQAASQQTGSTQQSSESKQSRDSGQSRPPPKEWRPWTRNGSFDSQAGHGGDWHRGGGGGLSKDVRISKALCKVLRHTAAERGIRLREDGFCDVEDLLKLQEFKSLGCNRMELVEICYGNDKQRFEVKQEPNMILIRAVQGHSMKEVTDEALLTPISLSDINFPDVCVHGTYRNLAASICNKGLLAGGGTTNRKHIHFAPYEPGDGRIISGMKYNCDIACYVDLRKAILAGIPFFRSTNNVILTPGDHGRLEPQYITKWKDVRTKEEFRGDHFREPAAPGAVPAGSFNGLAPAIAGGGPLAFCPTALAQSSLGGGLATQMVSPHLR